ncbi:MAG: hypothetical protein BGN92_01425 [Sphingobacteriales bacterium 41-5]|nr:MAG: hypothetical protein ABS67_02645 [Niabella sp. SCN 42-15]OJU28670.1 MAG: hypothetical protein BGN92_01425 [Sphingobacteriales bacterium 41-5]
MVHTVADGFPYYIELTEGKDIKELFTSNDTFDLLHCLTEEQGNISYAPGKWTIKQLVGHITDHERVMAYRAFRFSRKDETVLSGYDQEVLVNGSRFTELPLSFLISDFEKVRTASNSFIESLSPQQLQLKGTAWIFTLTVEEFLRATIGHELHHVNIIKERYLKL